MGFPACNGPIMSLKKALFELLHEIMNIFYIDTIMNYISSRSHLEPMVNYIGNIHGDETVGRQIILYLAQYLLQNYGKDSRVTNLVDHTEIFLMPSSNPDGYEVALPEQGRIYFS